MYAISLTCLTLQATRNTCRKQAPCFSAQQPYLKVKWLQLCIDNPVALCMSCVLLHFPPAGILKAEKQGGGVQEKHSSKATKREFCAEQCSGGVAAATAGGSRWEKDKNKNKTHTSPPQVPLKAHAFLLVSKSHCVDWHFLPAKRACHGPDIHSHSICSDGLLLRWKKQILGILDQVL